MNSKPQKTMSSTIEAASEYTSNWITIDTDSLTDRSLHPLCFQADSINLGQQMALEMGLRVRAGPPSGLSEGGELSVRTIHPYTKRPAAISTPTVSANHPVVDTTGEGHPGLEFLDQTDNIAALTVTTATTSPTPIDLSTSSDTTAASMFGSTNAGAIGSALKTLPTECTQDIYIQVLVVSLGNWTPSQKDTTEDQISTPESVPVYAVGITIFVAYEDGNGASGAVPAGDSVVRVDATTVSNKFTAIGNTPTPRFRGAWRHSTPAEEIIRTPTLKPNPTRYRWFAQRLKLERIIQTVRSWSVSVARLNKVHSHVPHTRQVIGTPAKIRVQQKDLAWLLGPPAQCSGDNSTQ